jgi:ATP-binding cassette subfamily B protein
MNTTKETIRLFWYHATRYPRLTYSILALAPITTLIYEFLPPLIMANVINRLSTGAFNKHDLWGSFGHDLLLYIGLVALGAIVLWRVVVILIWRLEARVIQDIAQRLHVHLLLQSADFHANHFGGSLVSQSTKLTGAYVRFADTTIFQVIPFFCSLIFTVIILAPRAPLFVALLVLCSIAYMISAIFVTKHVRKLNAQEATLHSKQTGVFADTITNVMTIKSFGAGEIERKRFADATEVTRNKTHEIVRAVTRQDLYFTSITSGVKILALVMATAGIVLFDANLATAFLILTYTARVSQGLWEFSGSVLRAYNRSLGDAKDMVEILHIDPEVQDPAQPEVLRIRDGGIDFTDVVFTHSGSDDALFNGLNLHIKPGEKIGLVGHSGSGKTTLTRVLLRFSDINGGAITIDGQNIANITQDDLRRSIAYVPQEPLLFHRSIKENIAYGKPGATDDEIFAAAKKANADEFIHKLSQGYSTMVGERGVKLSGGQRQRIAIARAILKDAPILVLDEATSALDSESELLIQAALQELMQKRTAIVIAHRLSTIQKMDRIIVLEDGKIMEQGSHADLTQKKGIYAQLWAHQSGGFIEE